MGHVELQSRNGNDITDTYPEVVKNLQNSLMGINSAVLDGEIVVLDKDGHPDFQGNQRRMHIQNAREIEKLANEIPAVYYLFDIFYHEGKNVEQLSYLERRQLLTKILRLNENIHLKDLFKDLKIKSFVKTSGKTGLHIYVPIKNEYTYDQTRSFAEIIGKMLMSRFPQKITMEWNTAKKDW